MKDIIELLLNRGFRMAAFKGSTARAKVIVIANERNGSFLQYVRILTQADSADVLDLQLHIVNAINITLGKQFCFQLVQFSCPHLLESFGNLYSGPHVFLSMLSIKLSIFLRLPKCLIALSRYTLLSRHSSIVGRRPSLRRSFMYSLKRATKE